MIRTTPIPTIQQKPVYKPQIMTIGRLWGVHCIICNQELRGSGNPEKSCDYVCPICAFAIATAPKIAEEGARQWREGEKRAALIRKAKAKKPKTEYAGEKVVDRMRRLRAKREAQDAAQPQI